MKKREALLSEETTEHGGVQQKGRTFPEHRMSLRDSAREDRETIEKCREHRLNRDYRKKDFWCRVQNRL